MFLDLFRKKQPAVQAAPAALLVAHLNARLQPLHRGEFFEDPLEVVLANEALGDITGGGTLQQQNGEIASCDIEIEPGVGDNGAVERIIQVLEALGAPRGSYLQVGDRRIPFGATEGLAIYLNGTDLPADVYQSCNSNFVFSELDRLLLGHGRVLSYWEGPTETAFYLYGASFDAMRTAVAGFIASYPLCQGCRIVQIA